MNTLSNKTVRFTVGVSFFITVFLCSSTVSASPQEILLKRCKVELLLEGKSRTDRYMISQHKADIVFFCDGVDKKFKHPQKWGDEGKYFFRDIKLPSAVCGPDSELEYVTPEGGIIKAERPKDLCKKIRAQFKDTAVRMGMADIKFQTRACHCSDEKKILEKLKPIKSPPLREIKVVPPSGDIRKGQTTTLYVQKGTSALVGAIGRDSPQFKGGKWTIDCRFEVLYPKVDAKTTTTLHYQVSVCDLAFFYGKKETISILGSETTRSLFTKSSVCGAHDYDPIINSGFKFTVTSDAVIKVTCSR